MSDDYGFEKWRVVIDGDTWFGTKNIKGSGNGIIGLCRCNLQDIKFFIRTGAPGKIFNASTELVFSLGYKKAEQLVSFLKECHEKAKSVSEQEWLKNKDTYIIRELETKYGIIIHLSSMANGNVCMAFLSTDKKGPTYMTGASKLSLTINSNGVEEFVRLIEGELLGITDQYKKWHEEAEAEVYLVKHPPERNNKWWINKIISLPELQKRIKEYCKHFKTEPENVEMAMEFVPGWEIDGPSIVLRENHDCKVDYPGCEAGRGK